MLPEIPENLENLPKLRKFLDQFRSAILEGGLGGGGASTQLSVVDGTTTDIYATVLDISSASGLLGQGTLLNTSSTNTLTVQETVVDAFGSEVIVSNDVLPGDTIPLSLQIDLGGGTLGEAYPPYISYLLEVKSTVSPSHAAYEMRFTGIY